MLIQRKCSITLLSLLAAIVITTSILDSAGAATHRFVVQNVKISPRFAKIGENVRVKANIRNNGNTTKNCNIKTFVGDSVIEEIEEISISPQETFPLLFTVNTSSLTMGKYPIEMIIEDAQNEQSLFDLGTIAIEQESHASFNMLYLLPVFPIGAIVSFFVWKKVRSRKDDKLPNDLMPDLLNEIMNFEENVETGAVKNKNSSDDRSYVR